MLKRIKFILFVTQQLKFTFLINSQLENLNKAFSQKR